MVDYGTEGMDGGDLCIGLCRWGTGDGGLNCVEGMQKFILKGRCICREARMAEFDSIGDADGTYLFVEDSVAPVVMQGWSEVKTVYGAEVPGAADGGFVMYENFAAGGSHWCCIKIEGSKEGVPGGWGHSCGTRPEEV